MPLTRRLLSAMLLTLLFAPPAAAQEQQDQSLSAPHVRPVDGLRSLVEEAARRSPEGRTLLDQLEDTDVIVYIRGRNFEDPELDGRVALLALTNLQRYLVIEISSLETTIVQMGTLGHELYHALEIAREPSIVDIRSARRALPAHRRAAGRRYRTPDVRDRSRLRGRTPHTPRIAREQNEERQWILKTSFAGFAESSSRCRGCG